MSCLASAQPLPEVLNSAKFSDGIYVEKMDTNLTTEFTLEKTDTRAAPAAFVALQNSKYLLHHCWCRKIMTRCV